MRTAHALANSKPLSRKGEAAAKGYAKSRVSNGRDILPRHVDGKRLDQRSLIVRRFRDIANQMAIDAGGADCLSEAKLQLIRRFSAVACLAEQIESRLARGEEIDITEHSLLCSTMTRLAQRIGVERVPKNITTLESYLQQNHPAPRAAE
jgi:hypothetical protein